MVKKIKVNKTNKLKAERYIFFILSVSYILGINSGCYFILKNNNIEFIEHIILNNSLNSIIYIIVILLLKYSGILNSLLYTIPFFNGIQNAVIYCNEIVKKENFFIKNLHMIIKDTAILFLIILYLIIIILQILNKKYNLKKDIKYLSIYIIGVIIIHSIYLISLKFII